MRRSPVASRPTLSLCGAWVLALALATSASAQQPPAKKAATPPPPDTSPLARYVPKDDLIFYFEFSGLDAHAAAWQKTAAYRMLNETPLGAMLEDLGIQIADKALGLRPAPKLSGAEVITIVKHMAQSGFVVGVSYAPQKPDDGVAMMVIRGASRREARATFGGLIRALSVATGKPQTVKMGGERSVVNMPGATPKQSWTWWAERNDLIFAAQPSSSKDRRGAERVIEVLDRKRPGAVGHPILAELVKEKGAFQPVGLGFALPVALPAEAAGMKTTLDRLGLGGIQRIDFQWGLEDNSLMSVIRVMAPRPRQGLLGLYDQPTFEKGDLPPLPTESTAFRVVSLDLPESLDTLLAVARSMGGSIAPLAQRLLDQFKDLTRLDLREDVLAHLGPKMAFYVTPDKPEDAIAAGADAGGAGGGGLGGLPGGFDLNALMATAVKVPKFTLVAEVKDVKAVGRALDGLIVEVNKGLREWRAGELDRQEEAREAREAAAAGPDAPKKKSTRQPRRAAQVAAPVFRGTGTGDMKTYVLNMPNDMPRLPSGIRPTIRLGAEHIVVSVSPEAAKVALEKVGEWTPPPDLVSVFERLPSPLVSLSINDPRSSLPAALASLPATLQKTINTALVQIQASRPPTTNTTTSPAATPNPAAAPPGGSPNVPPYAPPGGGRRGRDEGFRPMFPGAAPPGASGPPGVTPAANAEPVTIVLQVDPARMPSAEALKALLSPGSSAVTVDDQSIQFIRRQAFPEIGSAAPAFMLGMSAGIQAAARARGPSSSAPAPGPGVSAPPAGAPAATPRQPRSLNIR